MLVYIHVPFCRSRCRYCAFATRPLGRNGEGPLAAYCQTLHAEIDLWAEALGPVAVQTVFLGGGTPSLLLPEQIGGILEHLHRRFPIQDEAEITVEANPESAMVPGWLGGVLAAGVNRISFGVQSFHTDELRLLGRLHTAEQAKAAVIAARRLPFRSISLDLMWGLPCALQAGALDNPSCPDTAQEAAQRQQLARERAAMQRWQETLATAVSLGADHLSCYGLMLEDGTSLSRQAERGSLLFPHERTVTAQYLHTVHALGKAGLPQYEIANFARAGHMCKHNLGYWQGQEYMGLGPAAVGTVGGLRLTNPPDPAAWAAAVAGCSAGALPGKEREHLTPAVRLQERLMLALRTSAGIDLAEWEENAGEPLQTRHAGLMEQLGQRALARCANGRFFLTPRGLLLSNAIIEQFFDNML